MKSCEIFLADETRAAEFGRHLGGRLQAGHVVLLSGPVGAGKSHLSRAAIRHIVGAEIDVPSPTFTLVQTYDSPKGEIWHADLYRLTDPSEAEELGLLDAMENAIVLIEWPDRLGSDCPGKALEIEISYQGEGRHLTLTAPEALLDDLIAGFKV